MALYCSLEFCLKLTYRYMLKAGHVPVDTWGEMGVQWLSDRVLDSRPRGRGFEPHRRHCVVVLEQDTFILA